MATITSTDPRLKAGRKRVRKFHVKVTVVYEHDLSLDTIWTDGDEPTNPTPDDVIKVITEYDDSLIETLRDWNLIDSNKNEGIECTIDVEDIAMRSPVSMAKKGK